MALRDQQELETPLGSRSGQRSVDLRPHPPHHPSMNRRRFLLASLAGVIAEPVAAGTRRDTRIDKSVALVVLA